MLYLLDKVDEGATDLLKAVFIVEDIIDSFSVTKETMDIIKSLLEYGDHHFIPQKRLKKLRSFYKSRSRS